MSDELVAKKESAADEYCTSAETAFVQKVWQEERRQGIPSATVLAHTDGLTEVLDTDPANVDAIKARLREPELRVLGTVLPKPRRREVASLLERKFIALTAGRTAEYEMLNSPVGRQLYGRPRKRRAKR